jgi:hypothetical protein
VSAALPTEIGSLLKNIRFMAGASSVILNVLPDTIECLGAFDQVILPIINNHVRDANTRRWLEESLRSYSAVACWVVREYTRMADLAFVADLAVLGACFNRLYDDLFDEFEYDDALGPRLRELFRLGPFRPVNDVEVVLRELFENIRQLLNRAPDDPIFNAAAAVHEYQLRSSYQCCLTCHFETLADITRGKGGHAVVAMFALMRPSMSVEESNLLLRLGELIQMLDDYQDEELDAENGIHTLATEGQLGLSDIGNLLHAFYPDFCRYYGRRRVRRFWAFLYIIIALSFLCTRWPRFRVSRYPRTKGILWTLKILLAPDSGRLPSAAHVGKAHPRVASPNDTPHELDSGQY